MPTGSTPVPLDTRDACEQVRPDVLAPTANGWRGTAIDGPAHGGFVTTMFTSPWNVDGSAAGGEKQELILGA